MKPCALSKSVHTISRHVIHYTFDEQHTFTLAPALLSFSTKRPTSTSSNFLSGEIEPCADPIHVSIGYLAEPATFTSYEPKHLAENKDLAEHEDSRVNSFFFHRPSTALTFDSAVRALRRPLLNRTWTMSKFDALLASPLYLQEREANADRPQVCRAVRENLVSSSCQVPKSTGRPVARFSSKDRSNQETFSDRRFSSGHQQVLGNTELLSRFSQRENMFLSFSLDGWSVPRRALGNARFWRCWQRADGPTRVTDQPPVNITPLSCQQKQWEGWEGQRKYHIFPKGSVNHGQAASG